MADHAPDGDAPLVAVLLDLERQLDWDGPPRMFALVPTDELIAAEPALATRLGLRGTSDGGLPGALTAVEQDEFVPTEDLLADLAAISWPETVFGCAVCVERTFLPAAYEDDLPDDPTQAAAVVANHPHREDVRVVVGADRAGHRHGIARLLSRPAELLGGADLVPGLVDAVAHTLAEP